MKNTETNIASKEELAENNKLILKSIMGQLGIEYTYASDQRIEATMPVDERTCHPYGYLHGGASLTLGETLAGFGSRRLCNNGEIAVGQQVSGNHISSVAAGKMLKGIATIIHQGRKTHIWDVVIKTLEGKLVSTVRVVNFIINKNEK